MLCKVSSVTQIYVVIIRPLKCRKCMESSDMGNSNLSGWMGNSEKHVIIWMHVGKDQYNKSTWNMSAFRIRESWIVSLSLPSKIHNLYHIASVWSLLLPPDNCLALDNLTFVYHNVIFWNLRTRVIERIKWSTISKLFRIQDLKL